MVDGDVTFGGGLVVVGGCDFRVRFFLLSVWGL